MTEMTFFRKVMVLALLLALGAGVSACGRKGGIERLDDDQPRKTYPTR